MNVYIVSLDEKKYITRDQIGNFSFTTDRERAQLFEDKKANNIINNNLVRIKSQIKTLPVDESALMLKCNAPTMVDAIEEIAEQTYIFTNEKSNVSINELYHILANVPDLKNEKAKLHNKLVLVCKALTDTMHFKEFTKKRSASQRCKLDIFEEQLLVKRREIKDELFKIEAIEKILNGKADEGCRLNNDRKYQPRILDELFDKNSVPNFDEWWSRVS